VRLALGIEYDGTPYCGWQSQPGGCSVQDHLEKALQVMAGHPLRVNAAGRTDTGVHALLQVVHFDTETARPLSAWVRGVNAMLPDTIRVLWVREVPPEFHARFSAHERRYQYLLINSPVAPAIMSSKAGWFHAPLDVEAMQKAARSLVGEHDFSAFRAAECQAKTPVKHMQQADVSAQGQAIMFEFRANAFLHHQVRNMVGALIYIGKGKYPPAYMDELLRRRDRTQAPPTFSPSGLYLAGVGYEARWQLPETCRRLDFHVI
jgi:tRNA pseudouridine38-40 synthase